MFGAIFSLWSLKSHDSQHAFAKVRVVQPALTYSPTAFEPKCINDMRVTADLLAERDELGITHRQDQTDLTRLRNEPGSLRLRAERSLVRLAAGLRNFLSCLKLPDRALGSPSLLCRGRWGCFPGESDMGVKFGIHLHLVSTL